MHNVGRSFAIAAAVSLLWVSTSRAVTEQAAVLACQSAARNAANTFINGKVTAVGACLQAVAAKLMVNPPATPNPGGAAATCIMNLRKVYDSRSAASNKGLAQKLAASVAAKCGSLPFADISGISSTVSQPLETSRIDAWCAQFSQFGGTGPLASAADWATCLIASHECAADSAIAVQYPRAVELLEDVKPAITTIASTPSNLNQPAAADALTALDDIVEAIGGPTSNATAPQIQCGLSPVPTTCGNGTIETGEQCDGTQLGGATCSSVNARFDGGTLACTAACTYDLSACTVAATSNCGNGTIDTGEQCDGTQLGGATCSSVNARFNGGTLACTASCTYDLSACVGEASTGGMILNLVQAVNPCPNGDADITDPSILPFPACSNTNSIAPGDTPSSPLTLTGIAFATFTPTGLGDVSIGVKITGVQSGGNPYTGPLSIGGTVQFEGSCLNSQTFSYFSCTSNVIALTPVSIPCEGSGNCTVTFDAGSHLSYIPPIGTVTYATVVVLDGNNNTFLVPGLSIQ